MQQVQQTLRVFITENFLFGQDAGQLSETDSLIEKGVIDSTGILQLISFLESEFNLRVEDDEVVPLNLDSIALITAFVNRKRGRLEVALTPTETSSTSPAQKDVEACATNNG